MLFLLAATLSVIPGLAFPAHSQPAHGLEVVGKVPFRVPDGFSVERSEPGWVVLDSRLRRGYQIVKGNGKTLISSFDLDSLGLIRSAEVSGAPVRPVEAFGEIVHAVDERHGRIIFAWRAANVSDVNATRPESATDLLVLDERAFERDEPFERRIPLVPPVSADARALPTGMSYFDERGRGKVLLLVEGATSAEPDEIPAGATGSALPAYANFLAQWDIEPGGASDWVHPLSVCGRARIGEKTSRVITLPPFRSRRAPAVYLPCQSSRGVSQVVRVNLDATGRPSGVDESYPGPRNVMDVLIDPEAELISLRSTGYGQGESWWVFDGKRSGYAGVIGIAATDLGGKFATGIDPSTGRVYALTDRAQKESGGALGAEDVGHPGGILLADARRTPAPQGLLFTEYAGAGITRIMVDRAAPGRPTRLFVRPGTATLADHILVIADHIPVLGDPPLADVDKGTVDVPEAQGRTSRTFLGSGSGQGLRVLLVGGAQSVEGGNWLFLLDSACSASDRMLALGVVKAAALSESTARAQASSATADQGTIEDLAKPSGRCHSGAVPAPPPDSVDEVAGTQWPFASPECAGDGRREAPGPDQFADSFASVDCAQSKERVEAFGEFVGAAAGPVSIARASARVTTHRDPKRGVVVTTEALARGVEIDGVGRIELVRTIAESWANGRRGGAGTNAYDYAARKVRLSRVVCGVVIGSFVQEPCGDPQPAVVALNRTLGTRGKAELLEPDRDLAPGTPGGYLASVQKDRFREIGDSLLQNDPSTEVPGLRITFFRDQHRQVFDFATAAASSTYGIFRLPVGARIGPDGELIFEALDENGAVRARGGSLSSLGDDGSGLGGGVGKAIRRGLSFVFGWPNGLGIGVWILVGLPVYFVSRRGRLARLRSR